MVWFSFEPLAAQRTCSRQLTRPCRRLCPCLCAHVSASVFAHAAAWPMCLVHRKKPMTAVAFSADGSVLAVAAETVITLWDANTNILVAVIGEALSPITKLDFLGTSEYLVSLSQTSKPQVAVWNTSNLTMCWSYKIFAEAVCCSMSATCFAVLALINHPDDATVRDHDGIILLFNVEDPVPVSTWLAKKARRGGLAFLTDKPSLHMLDDKAKEDSAALLLAYVNGDHEYVVFDPQSKGSQISKVARRSHVQYEEAASFGYASIYGELPRFDTKQTQVSDVPFVPSERPWETIFSGSSHILPPLTKLCSAFLESLLEKRPESNEQYHATIF